MIKCSPHLGVFNEELPDQILGALGDSIVCGEGDPAGGDALEEQLLARSTRFSVIPATLETTPSGEGRSSEQHDVEGDAEGPHVAPLVVGALVSDEEVYYFGCHELSGADWGVHERGGEVGDIKFLSSEVEVAYLDLGEVFGVVAEQVIELEVSVGDAWGWGVSESV